MRETKTETLSIRLDADRKAALDGLCSAIGCKPGSLAAKAVEVWIDACASAGGYVPPKYSTDPGISPALLAEIIAGLDRARADQLLAADPAGAPYTTKKKGHK